MNYLPLVLLGALAAFPCVPRCACAPEAPDTTNAIHVAIEGADAILLGRVIDVERVYLPGDADEGFADWREVTLAVERRWKGTADRTVRVRTPWHASLCGFPFEDGREYLVYALVDEDGRLRTDACTRTSEKEFAGEDILMLDRIGTGLGG